MAILARAALHILPGSIPVQSALRAASGQRAHAGTRCMDSLACTNVPAMSGAIQYLLLHSLDRRGSSSPARFQLYYTIVYKKAFSINLCGGGSSGQAAWVLHERK